MQFNCCQDEVQLYLDPRYVSSCKGIWCTFEFNIYNEVPNIYHLQIYLKREEFVTWDDSAVPDLQAVVEQAPNRDTTLSAYLKANEAYP